MTAESDWLRASTEGAPAVLADAMAGALRNHTSPLPEALAQAALALFAEVVAGDGGRADALPLLGADALLTHAFAAQAELDPAGIPALADWATARLGELADR